MEYFIPINVVDIILNYFRVGTSAESVFMFNQMFDLMTSQICNF